MLKEVEKYIREKNLFEDGDKILLAVSGGIDSTVLTHLLNKLNVNFDISHCNFCLREIDADKDQHFVESLAKKLNVDCFVKHFDTATYATENKISIQMAARDLRYAWFNELIIKHNYTSIAVGTQLNDAIETFVLNAVKGTSILGLRGIQPENGSIVRPLLFATKQQIEKYAEEQNIEFRQDKSNDSTKYLRNKIRHQIIPVLQEINPSLESTFKQNFANLSFVEQVYFEKIEALKKELISTENDTKIIDLKRLKKLKNPEHYLFEFIHSNGFTFSDCEDIISASTSGKQFFTAGYQLVVNRNDLLIQKRSDTKKKSVIIEENSKKIEYPIALDFTHIPLPDSLIVSENIALLDANKVMFPLELRLWKQGDGFYPLGMTQKKKLSDFFIDSKLSILEKNSIHVLTSNQEIIWVIGYRIDNRYKVTASTTNVLQINTTK